MKKIACILIVLLPLMIQAQAHLGITVSEIKALHPDNVFIENVTEDGEAFAITAMPLGTFFYYFNESGLSYQCLQIPTDMEALNSQVAIYNGKYVANGDNSWKAYLEGGSMMTINLQYYEDIESYMFTYKY